MTYYKVSVLPVTFCILKQIVFSATKKYERD